MPLYEYTCEECHEHAELLINSRAEPVCPKCGSKRMHKEVSTFSTSGEVGSASAASTEGPGCCCMGPQGSCGLN